MNPSEMFTPAELIAFSEAFAKSLSALNDVASQQYAGVSKLAVDIMQATHRLMDESLSNNTTPTINATPDKIIEQLDANKSLATAPNATENPSNEITKIDIAQVNGNFYSGMLQALVNAFHNAVTNQQQVYTTSQAALTMGITTLYSLATAADSKAFDKKINSGA